MKEETVRVFSSGATRDTDTNKLDFEGFLSPLVLERYAEYMNKNRVQSNGDVRDSDNWQKGIPFAAYMKSWFRHFFAVWKSHRCGNISEDDLCGALFNNMGYLHEILQEKRRKENELHEHPEKEEKGNEETATTNAIRKYPDHYYDCILDAMRLGSTNAFKRRNGDFVSKP